MQSFWKDPFIVWENETLNEESALIKNLKKRATPGSPFITYLFITQIWIEHGHAVCGFKNFTMELYKWIIGKWPFYGHFPVILL